MTEWRCFPLRVAASDLINPSLVGFSPSWTVCFNSAFQSSSDGTWMIDNAAYETWKEVREWCAENGSGRMMVFMSGEVVCENEADANLLFLRFR